MTDYVSLNWKQFDEEFKPITNHFQHDPNQQVFETYGEEVEFVKAQDANKIWTWVSGDMCDLLINGFAYVNRLGYYITENPWDESKEYELIVSTEEECECYDENREDNDGEFGDANCKECEGYGYVTKYAD